MKYKKKLLGLLLMLVCLFVVNPVTAKADNIDDTGNTDQGNIGGGNTYTFYYYYNSSDNAIELTVITKNAIAGFGNTNSHTYRSPSDNTVLNTKNPILGRSLDAALSDLISHGGYDMTVAEAKAQLGSLGYYDKGNGVWKISGGYLTYVSAEKIKKLEHTVVYDANGGTNAPNSQKKKEGVTLTLRSGKPKRTGWTFKYWVASIGGHYSPGGSYTHDQDGGTVTMKAHWEDETNPTGTIVATPNYWSAGNGTVTINAQDQGSGLKSIVLERYNKVTGT